MSSAERAGKILLNMDAREFRILNAIEIGMIHYQFVPIDEMVKYTGYGLVEVKYWIDNLHKNDLILRQFTPYVGYILTYMGYDTLALNAFVKSNLLEALGRPIGIGKEADVLDALTPEGERVAVKFHRLGRTSFRDTKRKREYLADHQHTSWLYQSRLAAEKEFEALNLVEKVGVQVPRPIDRNRHAIVMEYVDGYMLSEVDELDDPEGFLKDIIDDVKKAYNVGVIHSDLSEFNVLLTKKGVVKLIDWPQYISVHHPNSRDMIKRDISNIVYYFQKNYEVSITKEEAFEYVTGLVWNPKF